MLDDILQQQFEKKRRIRRLLTCLKSVFFGLLFYIMGVECATYFNSAELIKAAQQYSHMKDQLSHSGVIGNSISTYIMMQAEFYIKVFPKAPIAWVFALVGVILVWLASLKLSKKKDIDFYKTRSLYYRKSFYDEKKKSKIASKNNSSQFQQFLSIHDHIPVGFFLLSEEERILHMNKFAKDMLVEWLDETISARQLLGLKMQDVMPTYLESGMGMVIQSCSQRKEGVDKEVYIVPKDAWLHVRAFPSSDGIALYIEDITEKKKPENSGKFSDVLLSKVSTNIPMAFAVVDAQWNYMLVSKFWQTCFKLEKQDLVGKNHKLVLPRFPGKWPQIESQLSKGKSLKGDEAMFHLGGKEEWISWEISPWKNSQGQLGGYFIYANLVTEQKHNKDKLLEQSDREKRLAYHDILTGLPNRQLFYDRLNMALANAYRHLGKVSLMFLDLDGFKAINDNLGHDVGDMLLKEVSVRLKKCVRDTDTVARLGGDEFTVVLTDINDEKDVETISKKIIDAINTPFVLGQHEIQVSTSIGISMYPVNGSTSTELIKKSDSAMYWSKEHGKNRATFFSQLETGALDHIPAVPKAARGTLEKPIKNIENTGEAHTGQTEVLTASQEYASMQSADSPLYEQLKTAIAKNELEVHYQPIFNIQNNTAVGVEALLRWRHKEYGLLSPIKFIDLAEETGLILPIGSWVFDQVCHKAKEWRDAGHKGIRFCINLSEKQILDPDLISRIEKPLRETGTQAAELAFEMTESVLNEHVETTQKVLSGLHQMGCKIIIDDYGMAYSPLKNMQKLPIDMIKIHRSFVKNITISKSDQSVVQTLIALGKVMKITIIGEGVETPEQADYLKEAGCEYAQGFLLGRPMYPIDTQEFFSVPSR